MCVVVHSHRQHPVNWSKLKRTHKKNRNEEEDEEDEQKKSPNTCVVASVARYTLTTNKLKSKKKTDRQHFF